MYDGKVGLWLRFNRGGDGLRPYYETEVTVDKFELFAGWLLGDHSRGIAGQSKDKDLNSFRSAINRFLADNGHGRPLWGNPNITRIIQSYRTEMQAQQELRGVVIDMQRIPTPQPVFDYLLQLRFSPLVPDADLQLVGIFVLQILGWLRADSIAGFELGGVVLDDAVELTMAVRRMKMRPAFVTQPGLIHIPPGDSAVHPRSRLFAILRRCFQQLGPAWYLLLRNQELFRAMQVQNGESRPAAWLTQQI
eukprot:SAG31_NODE_1080_length_10027_cov_8.417204_4_plen_249_part_00